jgi:hypothetical protein
MDNTSMFSRERFYKILSITSFFLILVVLIIILHVDPASSYEFSIYDAYPWYFWVLILSVMMCGQVVMIGSAITQTKKNFWLFGFYAILISNAILLFMPMIRGYYIYGNGDPLTHVGLMKDILQTSSILANHYPIDHLLGVIILLFSGLSLTNVIFFIPPFFSFFFLFSLYFVGKSIFKNKIELIIFLILSPIIMIGILGLMFTPNAQAFSLIPLVLYLAFRMYNNRNTNKYHFLLILIGCLLVFYHPLVAIIVILILCIMQIMQYILEKYEKKILKKVNYIYAALIMLIVFSVWSTYISLLIWAMEPFAARIFGNEHIESEFQENVNLVSQVNVDPIYILKLIFNIYGQSILLGILSLLCIGLILKSFKNQRTKLNFYNGISVLGYSVFFMLSIGMVISASRFGFVRIYNFATIFSLLLIPMGLYLFFYINQNEKTLSRKTIIKMLSIFFIIFCVSYFSIFNLYASPIIKAPNLQVSKSDYIGMTTFFTYRNESLPILELGMVSFRFSDAIYGFSARRSSNINGDYMIAPDHFGYQDDTLSRKFYENEKYLLLNDLGKEWQPNMIPEFENKWSFRPEDFEQLQYDSKIQRIYSNKNLDVYIVSAQQQEDIN